MPAPTTATTREDLILSARAIGSKYLEDHPDKTELHGNQAIAEELAQISDTATVEEINTAVCVAWSELDKKHGRLANALKGFYLTHYNLSDVPTVFARQYNIVNIQQIGKIYLAAHPKKTWMHTNQQIAERIAAYNPDSAQPSDDEVERFLMTQYFDLPKPDGKLGRAIEHFIKTYLGRNIPQGQVADVHLHEIHAIGYEYIIRHPSKSFAHENQAIAREISRYEPATLTNEGARKFLLSKYYDLRYFSGELSSDIKKYYVTHFGTHLTPQVLIQYFPVEQVKAVGEAYIEKNGSTPSPWYVFMGGHKNQAQALQLQKIEASVEAADPDKRHMKMWTNLIEIYGSLPNPDGELARYIEDLIKKVFIVPGPEKVLAQGGNAMPKTQHQISVDLFHSIENRLNQAFNRPQDSISLTSRVA
jgi:hypothetical protein